MCVWGGGGLQGWPACAQRTRGSARQRGEGPQCWAAADSPARPPAHAPRPARLWHGQVREAAVRAGVPLGGENALPCFMPASIDEVALQVCVCVCVGGGLFVLPFFGGGGHRE